MTKRVNSFQVSRRGFIRSTAVAGGGIMLGFNWTAWGNTSGANSPSAEVPINAFLRIATNGKVTIRAPNPEFGQGVKTSLPMIVAEELDVDWDNVVVEQAPFDTDLFTRQFAGGSQSVRQGWEGLRRAGATARQMLRQAAAQSWDVPVEEVTSKAGQLFHAASSRSLGYGEVAAAAALLPIPEQVELRNVEDFTIVGSTRRNVDAPAIVTGQPLFGMDVNRAGMLIATIVKPPAFGMRLKSFDDTAVRQLPGIVDVFQIKTLEDDYQRRIFDDNAFPELVVIVGEKTWQVFAAKAALRAEWEPVAPENADPLESTETHVAKLAEIDTKGGKVARSDGDPESAFASAQTILERTYTAPFLAHNAMEPQNFFAEVVDDKVFLEGPLQAPQIIEQTVAARLGVPLENIEIKMTRMGGGFGRRAYCHYVVEAALISQRMKRPVKLVYTREDDMSFGIYRPAYRMTYRAAVDSNRQLTGIRIQAAGIPASPLHPDRFPAGAVGNYLAESLNIETNITTGAFRAPRSNFNGSAEQCFLDELAETLGKDPIDFRLELLERARTQPVGERNDYDPVRYAGVLKLVREKSGWDETKPGVGRGVAAYYCHNSYVAHVIEVVMQAGRPVVECVCSAVDCGIVINRGAAENMVEGAVIDGIGTALYGALSFQDGVPQKNNFDRYRLIRMPEIPKKIEVHFVENDFAPTGLGEPPYPPVFAALANALYQVTRSRFYHQPYIDEMKSDGGSMGSLF